MEDDSNTSRQLDILTVCGVNSWTILVSMESMNPLQGVCDAQVRSRYRLANVQASHG